MRAMTVEPHRTEEKGDKGGSQRKLPEWKNFLTTSRKKKKKKSVAFWYFLKFPLLLAFRFSGNILEVSSLPGTWPPCHLW